MAGIRVACLKLLLALAMRTGNFKMLPMWLWVNCFITERKTYRVTLELLEFYFNSLIVFD